MKIKIGVSARHVHLCKNDLDKLFGENYSLTKLKSLSQESEYACVETVTIKTEKGKFDNVRILGPVRNYTQIEVSKTDSYTLGLNPPVRNSSDIVGSAPITIVNGNNELKKEYGCIIATRHVHMSEDDASKLGIKEGQVVKIKLDGEKGGIINNVHVKINPSYKMELHLDLDDANAHLIKTDDEGEMIINE